MLIENQKNSEEVFKAILKLKNIKEIKLFMRDLLTEKELEDIGLRWQVARMLNQKYSYQAIESATGLSSRTISRISKWLNNGRGGYRLVLGVSLH